MIRNAQKALAILGLMVSLAAAPAQAGSPERITIEIPFEFTVGKETLPAGTYDLYPTVADRVSMLRSTDSDHTAFATVIPVATKEFQSETTLVFRRYGDQYFLARIWVAGRFRGGELAMSSAERELRKGLGGDSDERLGRAPAQPEIVTLLARR
jgi:hypothetical protein